MVTTTSVYVIYRSRTQLTSKNDSHIYGTCHKNMQINSEQNCVKYILTKQLFNRFEEQFLLMWVCSS
jgi:hypothetical protein